MNPDIFYTYWRHGDTLSALPRDEVIPVRGLEELSVDDYLKMVTEASQLPKDVKGILKNAEWGKAPYPKDVIYGELWFNPQAQFPNGIGIYTSRVNDVRSDGVYCTLHSKYFVQFKPGEEKR